MGRAKNKAPKATFTTPRQKNISQVPSAAENPSQDHTEESDTSSGVHLTETRASSPKSFFTDTTGSHQRFIITPSPDFPTAIEALLSLEEQNSSLQVSTKLTQKGDFILQAKNTENFHILVNIATFNKWKSISLLTYNPPSKKTKMVLEGYAHDFPMG